MLRHNYSFAGLGLRDEETPIVKAITGVKDELLAIVSSDCKTWLLQGVGFGGKNIDISWHESKFANPRTPIAMYPIEL